MSRSPLELRHLRSLLAIEQTGSLTKAAELMFVTQSAVSHQIKALEAFYGEGLLYRQEGKVCFSVVGQRLLELAHQVLPEIDQAELDLLKLKQGAAGPLRVAIECHTCFDWLMPSMDMYRTRWPEVELDIVSGFHADPVGLLHQGLAELAVVSEDAGEHGVRYVPLFQFDMVGVIPVDSELIKREFLQPEDFIDQTLISYPVPDDMLDVVKHFLAPAGVQPKRRSSELTVALLQLVASKRGLAALPAWAVKDYVAKGYVATRPLGKTGLRSKLYAAVPEALHEKSYVTDFVHVIRETCVRELDDIWLLNETSKG
jgi:LysR family transcriptional regulator, regulator for metE and metH